MLTFMEFIETAAKKTVTFTPEEVSSMPERDAAVEMGDLQEDGSLVVSIGRLLAPLEDLVEYHDDSDVLFEMANLGHHQTGLPFLVWISTKSGARHDVRVKVSRSPKARPSEMVSVAIRPDIRVVGGSLSGSELNLLKKWIELNHGVILRYWNGEILTDAALAGIRPIK